jgi:hypothetical protein
LIEDAVAEMEFVLRRESAVVQRRKMKRYGIKYRYRSGEPAEEEEQVSDEPVQ